MNIKELKLEEIDIQELKTINGGDWIGDLAESVGRAVGYTIGVAVGSVVVAAHIVADRLVKH